MTSSLEYECDKRKGKLYVEREVKKVSLDMRYNALRRKTFFKRESSVNALINQSIKKNSRNK